MLFNQRACKPRPKEKDTAPFAPWQLNPPIHKTQNPPKYGHVDVMKTEILAKHGSMDNYSKYLKQKKIPIATSLPPPTLPPIVSYRGTGLGSIALVTPANFPVHPYPGEKEENYERLKIQIEGQLIQSTPLTLEEQLLQLYAIEEERDIREAVKDEACNKAEERIRQRDRQRLRRRYGHWLSDRIELEKEKGKQIVQNQTQNMHLDLQEDEKLALRAFLNVPPPSRSDLKRLDKYDRRAFERERDIEREYRLSDYADGNDREKLFFYNGFFVGKQQAGLGFELEKGVDYEDILADDGLNRQGAWDVINHQDGVQQHKTYSQNDAIDIKGDQKSNENQNAINWKNYQIRNKLREDNQIQNFDNQQIQDQSQNQRIPVQSSSQYIHNFSPNRPSSGQQNNAYQQHTSPNNTNTLIQQQQQSPYHSYIPPYHQSQIKNPFLIQGTESNVFFYPSSSPYNEQWHESYLRREDLENILKEKILERENMRRIEDQREQEQKQQRKLEKQLEKRKIDNKLKEEILQEEEDDDEGKEEKVFEVENIEQTSEQREQDETRLKELEQDILQIKNSLQQSLSYQHITSSYLSSLNLSDSQSKSFLNILPQSLTKQQEQQIQLHSPSSSQHPYIIQSQIHTPTQQIPRSSPGSGLNTNQNNQNKDSSFITDVGLISITDKENQQNDKNAKQMNIKLDINRKKKKRKKNKSHEQDKSNSQIQHSISSSYSSPLNNTYSQQILNQSAFENASQFTQTLQQQEQRLLHNEQQAQKDRESIFAQSAPPHTNIKPPSQQSEQEQLLNSQKQTIDTSPAEIQTSQDQSKQIQYVQQQQQQSFIQNINIKPDNANQNKTGISIEDLDTSQLKQKVQSDIIAYSDSQQIKPGSFQQSQTPIKQQGIEQNEEEIVDFSQSRFNIVTSSLLPHSSPSIPLQAPLTPHQHNEQIQKITPLPIQSAKHSQSSKIQQHTGNTTSLSRSQLETPKFVSSAPSTTTRRWKELDMRSSAVREYQSDREADVLEKANEIIYRAETENWFGFQNDGGEKQ